MAKIIVKGECVDVEIVAKPDRTGRIYALVCDRGAWCSLGPSQSTDLLVIVVLACRHADTEHS